MSQPGPVRSDLLQIVKCFLALWLIATLLNLWFGVSRAGYTVRDEAPVALVVLVVPAIAAVAIWWRGSYP